MPLRIKLFTGLFWLCSAVLLWFGVQLILLGGSPYYLAAGLICASVAWLTRRRQTKVLGLYTVFYAATLIWALWESGLNGWALTGRLAFFTVLGLWMLAPHYRSYLGLNPGFSGAGIFWPTLSLSLVLTVAVIFYLDTPTRHPEANIDYSAPVNPRDGKWHHYGNTQAGSRFSPLVQITPENIGKLEPAWTYHAGTRGYEPASIFEGILTIEATPLAIGDRLYLCTGYNDIIALDAETGREIWRHESGLDARNVATKTCRGVSYYAVPEARGFCSHRIYTATLDARLIAVDADSGKSCTNFGRNGVVDLLQGMGEVVKGYYYVTSPPAVIRGRLVLGGWVLDGQHTEEPSGVIRAFDAVTGEFSWAFDIGKPDFHSLPPEGEFFTRGTPNSWSVMSADEELGLVYVPTGNATPDYYGGHRSAFDDTYSSAVVALNAETGEDVWVFQTTHHDLWDYDVASQPVLIDLPDGRKGLLQPTKRGEIFFLDRTNGAPLTEVKELPVPQGALPGDWLAPTQPYSTGLPSFEGVEPSEKTMWGVTPLDHAYCRVKFLQARYEGTMTPIGVEQPTITWPGFLGGINWGSVSIDPARQLMLVNSTHVMMYNRLVERAVADEKGVTPITADGGKSVGLYASQTGTPYAALIKPFLSFFAAPCQQPPYGLMSAVDLSSGRLLWQKPLGTSRDSGPLLLRSFLPLPIGVPNLGGSLTTASGLTFIAATQEKMIRAFDNRTGEKVWQARLPAGGHATPMTYWSDKSQRQFVVIAAGGHTAMLSSKSDAVIAYALPVPSHNQQELTQ